VVNNKTKTALFAVRGYFVIRTNAEHLQASTHVEKRSSLVGGTARTMPDSTVLCCGRGDTSQPVAMLREGLRMHNPTKQGVSRCHGVTTLVSNRAEVKAKSVLTASAGVSGLTSLM